METSKSQKRRIQNRFPRDFPERLELFRETAGLSWKELAACIGVRRERVTGWRRGTVPRSSALMALIQLARRVPGGMEALFPNLAEAFRWEEGGE